MTIRNILQPVVRPIVRALGQVYGLFSPASLFNNGETGVWYDPSDFSTLFQDSAGTTPVTAVEQPVGKMLDKSGRGNHATQATAASRPVVSARVNLLTKSEDFGDAAWVKMRATIIANATTAPDGSLTADKLTGDGTATSYVYAAASFVSGSSYVASIRVKPIGSTYFEIKSFTQAGSSAFTLTGAGSAAAPTGVCTASTITALGDGWYLLNTTILASATGSNNIGFPVANYIGDICYIWGADLRVTNTGVNLPSYQRVNTATDYDTVGFPTYLAFNGTNSSMATGSIDFTSTSAMTVFAGVRKLSDATAGQFLELSSNYSVNNGSFTLSAPEAATQYGFAIRGTTGTYYLPISYTAPITNVLTILADIGQPTRATELVPRVNGVINQTNPGGTVDAGSGNFGNYPLYIGARAGTTVFFNGNLYSMIVRGAQSSAAQITSAETYVNGKTRAY